MFTKSFPGLNAERIVLVAVVTVRCLVKFVTVLLKSIGGGGLLGDHLHARPIGGRV